LRSCLLEGGAERTVQVLVQGVRVCSASRSQRRMSTTYAELFRDPDSTRWGVCAENGAGPADAVRVVFG